MYCPELHVAFTLVVLFGIGNVSATFSIGFPSVDLGWIMISNRPPFLVDVICGLICKGNAWLGESEALVPNQYTCLLSGSILFSYLYDISLKCPSGGTNDKTRSLSHLRYLTQGWKLTSSITLAFTKFNVKSGIPDSLLFVCTAPWASQDTTVPFLYELC